MPPNYSGKSLTNVNTIIMAIFVTVNAFRGDLKTKGKIRLDPRLSRDRLQFFQRF